MILAALVLPVLALPLAWRAPTASQARRWVGWLALVVAGAWLAAVLLDADATVGRFGAAPAAVGTWALVASTSWPARRLPTAVTVLAAAVAAGGLALLAGDGDLSDAAGALALASALVVLAARLEADGGVALAAIGALGTAAVAGGLVRLEGDTGGFARGGGLLVLLGAAAVVVAAGGRARRAGVVVLPLALVLGAQAGCRPRDAIVLGLAGLVLTDDRPATSLGLWSLALATISPPAGLLLGAAAVVEGAWLHPLAPLAALPGVAAAVYAGGRSGGVAVLVLAALAALTVARLWRDDGTGDDVIGGRPSPATAAAVVTGAWLVLGPETWGWAVPRPSAAGLDEWGTGVLVAAVAAAVAAFVAASFTDAPFRLPDVEVADPVYPAGDARSATVAGAAALVILGLAGAALVASVVS